MKRLSAVLAAIDLPLLLLLTVVANQGALWLKFVGLLGVFALRPQFKGLLQRSRLLGFIPLLMLAGAVNFFGVVRDFSFPSLANWGVSIAFWGAAFLGAHQVRLSVERAPQKIAFTLRAFVLLNVAMTLGQLAYIAWSNGVWNPYKNLPFPYGMSTGDLLAGVFWEGGYTNAFVNALLAIYFLFQREWVYAGWCLLLLLLVFGNVMLLSTVLVLMGIACFGLLMQRWRSQQRMLAGMQFFPVPGVARMALLFACLLVGMLACVSSENVRYIIANLKGENTGAFSSGPKSSKTLRYWVRGLHFDKYKTNGDCLPDTADLWRRKQLTLYAVQTNSAKKLSILETAAYLQSGWGPLMLGAGPGRFSSLTAARMSGLDSSRLFTRVLPRFSTCAYRENHRLIHQTRVSGDDAWLSTMNWPNSFFNQLLGEYGLVGLLLFLTNYVWRYLRRIRQLSYGFWISVLMIPIALLTYLVEPLCVLFFYELLMEKDLTDLA